jgi:hypothetical protein
VIEHKALSSNPSTAKIIKWIKREKEKEQKKETCYPRTMQMKRIRWLFGSILFFSTLN